MEVIVEKGFNLVKLVGLNMLSDKKFIEYFVKGMIFIIVFKIYEKEEKEEIVKLFGLSVKYDKDN